MNGKIKVLLALAVVVALMGLAMGGVLVTNRVALAANPAPVADDNNYSDCSDMMSGAGGMMDGSGGMMGGSGGQGGTGMMGSYQGNGGMMGSNRGYGSSSGRMMGGYGL